MGMRNFAGALISTLLFNYGDGYVSLNMAKNNESYRQAYLMRTYAAMADAHHQGVNVAYKPGGYLDDNELMVTFCADKNCTSFTINVGRRLFEDANKGCDVEGAFDHERRHIVQYSGGATNIPHEFRNELLTDERKLKKLEPFMRSYAELDAYYHEIDSRYSHCVSPEFMKNDIMASVSKHEAALMKEPEAVPEFVEYMRKDVSSRRPKQLK